MMRCRQCGSDDIRARRRRGVLQSLAALVWLRPFRCRRCDRRFLAFRLADGPY
jgi:hypothetical protein